MCYCLDNERLIRSTSCAPTCRAGTRAVLAGLAVAANVSTPPTVVAVGSGVNTCPGGGVFSAQRHTWQHIHVHANVVCGQPATAVLHHLTAPHAVQHIDQALSGRRRGNRQTAAVPPSPASSHWCHTRHALPSAFGSTHLLGTGTQCHHSPPHSRGRSVRSRRSCLWWSGLCNCHPHSRRSLQRMPARRHEEAIGPVSKQHTAVPPRAGAPLSAS